MTQPIPSLQQLAFTVSLDALLQQPERLQQNHLGSFVTRFVYPRVAEDGRWVQELAQSGRLFPILTKIKEIGGQLKGLALHRVSLAPGQLAEVVEMTPHLVSLRLKQLREDHLSPLLGLTKLREFHLHCAYGVNDVTAIAQLTRLERLTLEEARVDVLTAWKISPHLDNLSALSALTRLRVAKFGALPNCTDWRFLEGLTALEELSLSQNSVQVFPTLANPTRLTTLNLFSAKTENLDALTHLVSLTRLDLTCVGITDLLLLQHNTSLRVLKIGGIPVQDFSPLERFRALQVVSLCDTTIAHLRSLTRLLDLEELDLRRCKQLTSLEGLENMGRLRLLQLGSCNVSELTPIARCTALTSIQATHNHIADTSPLLHLNLLETLNLYGNPTSNLYGLRHLTKLRELVLDKSQATDWSPVSGLTALEKLEVANCRGLDDLSMFAALPFLREIWIMGVHADPTPLDGRPELKVIGRPPPD